MAEAEEAAIVMARFRDLRLVRRAGDGTHLHDPDLHRLVGKGALPIEEGVHTLIRVPRHQGEAGRTHGQAHLRAIIVEETLEKGQGVRVAMILGLHPGLVRNLLGGSYRLETIE